MRYYTQNDVLSQLSGPSRNCSYATCMLASCTKGSACLKTTSITVVRDKVRAKDNGIFFEMFQSGPKVGQANAASMATTSIKDECLPLTTTITPCDKYSSSLTHKTFNVSFKVPESIHWDWWGLTESMCKNTTEFGSLWFKSSIGVSRPWMQSLLLRIMQPLWDGFKDDSQTS